MKENESERCSHATRASMMRTPQFSTQDLVRRSKQLRGYERCTTEGQQDEAEPRDGYGPSCIGRDVEVTEVGHGPGESPAWRIFAPAIGQTP